MRCRRSSGLHSTALVTKTSSRVSPASAKSDSKRLPDSSPWNGTPLRPAPVTVPPGPVACYQMDLFQADRLTEALRLRNRDAAVETNAAIVHLKRHVLSLEDIYLAGQEGNPALAQQNGQTQANQR